MVIRSCIDDTVCHYKSINVSFVIKNLKDMLDCYIGSTSVYVSSILRQEFVFLFQLLEIPPTDFVINVAF